MYIACHADMCVCANRWSRCTLCVTMMVVCVCVPTGGVGVHYVSC